MALKRFILPLSIAAVFVVAIPTLLRLQSGGQRGARSAERRHGEMLHETVSRFSHIRVRERDGVRSLLFVNKDGRETLQSKVDLKAPHELQLRYSRAMFVSLLFREPQERVLIVGLGGGGMVRFLNEVLPETQVETVEIDPEVVRIAREYFGTSDNSNTRIHTEDAFVFLRDPGRGPFDVIYMDAFLRPPANLEVPDKTGRLKTGKFLRELQERLEPGGIVTFNLIEADESTADDLFAIRSAFSSVWVFSVPETGNLVVVASNEKVHLTNEDLRKRAESINGRIGKFPNLNEVVGNLRSD